VGNARIPFEPCRACAAAAREYRAVSITGKLVGAVIGLVVFHNPFAALIGALFGHFLYDAVVQRARPGGSVEDFVRPLFGFAGALSKSDGRVSEPEIAAAESLIARLRLDADVRRHAIESFTAGKESGFAIDAAIAELHRWTGGRRDRGFVLLDLLLDLVYAEGSLAGAKLALLRRLMAALGISDAELAALSAMRGYASYTRGYGHGSGGGRSAPPRQQPAFDPWAVLGIARDASEGEIKRAYRRLMSQHHPDKLGNVPDEIKRRAEERAGEINAAYEQIKSQRGLR
jgi:DnaJ like chaperone protein